MMENYFITLRPKSTFRFHSVKQLVRPIKRATHPCPAVAYLHSESSIISHDPHVHLTVSCEDISHLQGRLLHFLPDWHVAYAEVARNPKATVIYMSQKMDADPIFFRSDLAELC